MESHSFNGWHYKVNPDFKNQSDLYDIKADKHPILPTELFHYYKIDKNSVDSLLNNYIYANHPREFNDPFDCNRDLVSFESTSLDDVIKLNNGVFPVDKIKTLYNSDDPKDKFDLYNDLLFLLYNVTYMKLGIFCMTNNDSNMGMWSYYTNHRGFVLKFNLSKLPENHWGPFPINYTNEFKRIDYSKFKNSSFLYQSNIKAKCWEPENEWRLFFWGPNVMKIPGQNPPKAHDRIFFYDPKTIDEVILGYNFFESNEYDLDKSNFEIHHIRLRKNVKLKRKMLKFIIMNKHKVSIINIKKESSSDLSSRPVELIRISSNKYIIKYIG